VGVKEKDAENPAPKSFKVCSEPGKHEHKYIYDPVTSESSVGASAPCRA